MGGTRRDLEHQAQRALFIWAHLAEREMPELACLYAIPNGGARSAATGARLKAEGVRPGMPDVCLPVPRCGYSALYIELKGAGGRLSSAQRKMMALLAQHGAAVGLCYAWTDAARLVEDYLKERRDRLTLYSPPRDGKMARALLEHYGDVDSR